MACDMCGNNGRLYVTMVEGVEMQLCDDCKVYGEVKRSLPTAKEQEQRQKTVVQQTQRRAKHEDAEVFEMIVGDYGPKIKQARERMNKKQEELAKMLAIKESQLHKYESGHKRPDLETAKKLERALGITLIEAYTEENKGVPGRTSGGPMTIADLLKNKK